MKAEDRPEEELGHVPQFLLELKKKKSDQAAATFWLQQLLADTCGIRKRKMLFGETTRAFNIFKSYLP